jgi:Fur family ferric uptake transcriptional regulator
LTCETVFLNRLHKNGYRMTVQREMVLASLHEIGHPASAEELFDLVTKQNANVELSTIYRTLELLNSMDLVTVIHTANKPHLYELSGEHVSHLCLVCRVCGGITRVDIDRFTPFFDNLEDFSNFQVDLNILSFQGVCEDCRERNIFQ